MAYETVSAIAQYSYDEINRMNREAAEQDARIKPMFDPDNRTPAWELMPLKAPWIKVNGKLWYVAHDDIKLWHIAQTYMPMHQPWIDAAGNIRQEFSPSAATKPLFNAQPQEFKNVLRAAAKQYEPHLLNPPEFSNPMDVSTYGMPRYALATIPNGTPVLMPNPSHANALRHGVIRLRMPETSLSEPKPSKKAVIVVSTVSIAIAATSTYFIWKLL